MQNLLSYINTFLTFLVEIILLFRGKTVTSDQLLYSRWYLSMSICIDPVRRKLSNDHWNNGEYVARLQEKDKKLSWTNPFDFLVFQKTSI